jgi:hypothetical protein
MPISTEQQERVLKAAIVMPTVIYREMAERLCLAREDVVEACANGRVAICMEVLSYFCVDEVAFGPDLELAVCLIANKWPESTYADLAVMVQECFGAAIDRDSVKGIVSSRHDLLAGPRLHLERVCAIHETARRVVFFANRWPDAAPPEVATELGLETEIVRSALRLHPDLLSDERSEERRLSRARGEWLAKRHRRVIDYAKEHPELSLRQIQDDLGVSYHMVRTAIKRGEAELAGLPPRPRSSHKDDLPEWLELEDVLAYVEARDMGVEAVLPRTRRRT